MPQLIEFVDSENVVTEIAYSHAGCGTRAGVWVETARRGARVVSGALTGANMGLVGDYEALPLAMVLIAGGLDG
ncbi:hypothetical protein V6N12_045679 [Hibiscus sabdariffa]|uniref:Uncharacterized protein n=1 Tax=Hibiscus sabdariffa TaxID=183260 RepID=A0ABR2G3F0_9ROSI